MKLQLTVAPDGLVVHLGGPIEGANHDINTLRRSGLMEQVDSMTEEGEEFPMMAADLGFNGYPQFLCNFRKAEATGQLWNKRHSQLRCPVEWLIGSLKSRFSFLECWKRLKVGEQPLEKIVVTCILLHNLWICGNQRSETSIYYYGAGASVLPSIHSYLSMLETSVHEETSGHQASNEGINLY